MLSEREIMETFDTGDYANVEHTEQVAARKAKVAERQLLRFKARCTVSIDKAGKMLFTYNPEPEAPDFGAEKTLYPYTVSEGYKATKVFDKASPIFFGLDGAEIPFPSAVQLDKAERDNRRKRGNSVLYYAILSWNSSGMRRNGKGARMQYSMVASLDVQNATNAERGQRASIDGKAGRTVHTISEMFDSSLEYNTARERMKAERTRTLQAKKERKANVIRYLQQLAGTPDGARKMLETVRDNPTIRKRLSRMGISAKSLVKVAGE